jgi:tetratricopeptide (TPR) repeat protein
LRTVTTVLLSLAGFLLSLALAGFARTSLLRVRIYAIALPITTLFYPAFAATSDVSALLLAREGLAVAGFSALAWLGTFQGPAYLAAAWTVHVIWDLFYHLGDGAGTAYTPYWFPVLSASFSLVAAWTMWRSTKAAVVGTELLPSLKQFRAWSLPSKASYLSLWLAALLSLTDRVWWPLLDRLHDRLSRWPIPQADPDRFSILVARLENDTGREQERIIVEAISEFQGVQVLRLDKQIAFPGPIPEQIEDRGHEAASLYLKRSGATVLIWGGVLTSNQQAVLKLYWTSVGGGLLSPRRYDAPAAAEKLSLPPLFWNDLAHVLRLVILSRTPNLGGVRGQYVADQLAEIIPRVRRLIEQSGNRPGWNGFTRGSTRLILGNAMTAVSEQVGKPELLEEGITVYREALEDLVAVQGTPKWADAQNNLGNALKMLGERMGDLQLLEDAANAHRAALGVWTRERAPLSWAMVQNNLAGALATAGELKGDTLKLRNALNVVSEAKEVVSPDHEPRLWAVLQTATGGLLVTLGRLRADSLLLKEAIAAYYVALFGWDPKREPYAWAVSEANLGNALFYLGLFSRNAEHLDEAVRAYRKALREVSTQRWPQEWTSWQISLGKALLWLGKLKQNTDLVQEAVAADREGLKALSRQKAPAAWAEAQYWLGEALLTLGIALGERRFIQEAILAYHAALQVYATGSDRLGLIATKASLNLATTALEMETR